MAIKIDPKKDLKIDVTRLGEEFANFPSLLFAYLEIKVDLERDYEREKNKLSELRAALYKDIKAEAGKITEKALDAEIEDNKFYKGVKESMLEAKHSLETLKAHIEALRAKKDMLIQLGADSRAEKS